MAAALFELEENGDLKCDTVKTQTSVRSAKKRVRVFPFRNSEKDSNSKNENSEKAYSFYNFDKISADYEIYEDTLQEAKQLILLNYDCGCKIRKGNKQQNPFCTYGYTD